MNTAHWHLLLNHLPLTGIIIGTLVLVAGNFLKNNTVLKTALGIIIFTAVAVVPAFLTGEGAEEIAEKIPAVTEAAIEDHEERGKIFLIGTIISGMLSLITFLAVGKKSKLVPVLYVLVFVASLGTCILAKEVGTSGGLIRHTEINQGATAQAPQQDAQQPTGSEEDKE